MADRIYRYEVPVDGRWHELETHGPPLHVACRNAHVVEFWALADPFAPGLRRRFTVIGTNQQLSQTPPWWYRGTALAPDGLVWHLLEEKSDG